MFQSLSYQIGYFLKRLSQSFAYLLGCYIQSFGEPGYGIAPFYLPRELFVELEGRAYVYFYFFGGALANNEVVSALHILDNAIVEGVAAYADALGVNYIRQGYDGNFGCSAADIHNHTGVWLLNGEAHAYGGHQGFVFQAYRTGARVYGRLLHCAALDLRNAGRHRHNHPGSYKFPLLGGFFNKVAQHYFGYLKVGYNPEFHGTYRGNIAGSFTEHLFCLRSDCHDFFSIVVYGDHAWFAHYHAGVFCVNKGVCRAQVNAYVV